MRFGSQKGIELMRNSIHYESGVVRVAPEDGVCKIVDEMIHYSVGCVVVADEERRPLGIVTDRDLLERVVCAGLDPATTRADAVMTAHPVTGRTDEPLERIIARMKSTGTRRLPIVRDEKVAGFVSADDVIAEIGRELNDVREALRGEVLGARREAQSRSRRDEIAEAVEGIRSQVVTVGSESIGWVKREIDGLRKRFGG
jgi:CBS domain-containing protein